MKKYLYMSSAAVVIGALRVKVYLSVFCHFCKGDNYWNLLSRMTKPFQNAKCSSRVFFSPLGANSFRNQPQSLCLELIPIEKRGTNENGRVDIPKKQRIKLLHGPPVLLVETNFGLVLYNHANFIGLRNHLVIGQLNE